MSKLFPWMCLSICTELANKLQEEQEEIKCSDVDVQTCISPDPDESHEGSSPAGETLDCGSPNNTSTDYLTWNGTHTMAHTHSLEMTFQWRVSLVTFAGEGPEEDCDAQEGPENSWRDFLGNSLQCMWKIAVATEAVEQWHQSQSRAFTADLMCIKGSICLQLTVIMLPPLSSFMDHYLK